MANDVRVTVLVDNAAVHAGLATEHGLALWIEADGARILFDTGAGAALLPNAGRLGVPLDRATAIVLSHGHYDHTGGLAVALARARDARIYVHPDARRLRFSRRPGSPPRLIGMPPADVEALARVGDRVAWTEAPVHLTDNVGITGPIPRRTAYEDAGGPFFLDFAGATPDPFSDDQALWIRSVEGPIAVLGCAHAGVVNTVEAVAGLMGSESVSALIGGMHLRCADASRLKATADAFERRRVHRLAPCHCTGETASDYLRERFPDAFMPCAVGTHFSF